MEQSKKTEGRESRKDNDLFFTCSLIEYIARKTKNKRADVVNALGRKNIEKILKTECFYNPYSVKLSLVEQYYEAAHLGTYPKAIYSSTLLHYTKCSISRTLEQINNSIYILGGEEKDEIKEIIKEYTDCNPSIESGVISKTRHLPHLEKPEEVCKVIDMFFG